MLPDSERDESGPLYLGGSGFQLQHSQKGRATNVEEALLIRSSTRMHESLQPFPEQSFSSRRSRSSIASCQMNNHSSNSLHNQVDGTHVLPSSLCDSLASATELRPQSVQPMDSASAPLLGQSSATELSKALLSPRNSTKVQATDILLSRRPLSKVETLLEQTRLVDSAASCSADTAADGLVRRPVNQPGYLCVLDFEATCDEGKGFSPAEIIEFPAIILDTKTRSEVDNFHRYCRPVERPVLTEFCKSLTGITQEQVDSGVPFTEALHSLHVFLDSGGYLSSESSDASLLVVTCGDWDLQKMLPTQAALVGIPKPALPTYLKRWCNIKRLFGHHYRVKRPASGMVGMLNFLGLPLVGRHHSGIDDARNIARIAQRMLEDGCRFVPTGGKGVDPAALARAFETPGGECHGRSDPSSSSNGNASASSEEPGQFEATKKTVESEDALRIGDRSEALELAMVDIGCNLAHKSFERHVSDVLKRAAGAGVAEILVTGTSVAASETAVALCQEHSFDETGVRLTSTAGIHPHEATRAVHSGLQDSIQRLEALIQQHPRTIRAVGECGLDFDRDFSSRSDQEAVFRAQICLAKSTGLPLFMHERSAHEKFLEILAPHMGEVTGVVHCFTGDKTVLDRYLDLGLYIGVTGWVCDERRGLALQEAVPFIPLDRLLIETDAPFLLPRNIERGTGLKRPKHNEPAFLVWVARKIAELRGSPVEVVVQRATENSRRLFGLQVDA